MTKPNIWEFVRKEDGLFDILHNGRLLHSGISDRWLEDELVRYGFCGEEYREIRRQVEESGKAQIIL